MLGEKCDFYTQKVREHKNKLIHSHVGRRSFPVAQQIMGLLHTARTLSAGRVSDSFRPWLAHLQWPVLHTLFGPWFPGLRFLSATHEATSAHALLSLPGASI